MPNVQISDLPAALPLDGSELVPVVQGGVTVRTTTASVAGSPSQTQTFLTKNQEPTLPNSRALAASTGITLTDGGALSTYTIGMNGAAASLNAAGNGFPVKTGLGTVTPRNLVTSGSGISVTDGDGQAGNPTFQLTGLALAIANLSGAGLVASTGSGSLTPRILTGTANQITVTNGNGAAGNPTISIADNPVLPGFGAVTLPSGTTAERPVGVNGDIRFNTETAAYEAYVSGSWKEVPLSAGGVTSFSAGSTGFTPNTATTGDIVLGGILNPSNGGTGASSLTGYVKGDGTSVMTASATIPTTDLSGTISNAQLANNSTTINGVTIALGGSGTISTVLANPLTIGTGLSGTSYNGSSPVTVAIDSTVATLTGTQTLTNKTLTDPKILNTVKLTGAGASSYTPFIQTFSSASTNYNGYQLNYIQNVNNGSDASVDYVAYNDASDVDSYFVDMGISSSNYTSPTYTVFPPNAGYVYTGGGTSGQASALLLGTSNAASDIVMFTGGTLTANTRATVKGNTGNVLINTSTDTGEKLQVNGTSYMGGAATFGSTVLLNADPTLALQAATKAYVDSQVTAGIHIHEPVRVESTGNLNATYAQGGTTFNITAITSGTTVTTSVNHGLAVNDQIWLYTSAGNGLVTNTAYFVYSTPALNQLTLSLTFGGAQVTGLTNATGLTYATRANSGVGATLTNAGTQLALVVDGVTLSVGNRVMVRLQTNGAQNGVYVVTSVGSILTNWVLTRATDANVVSPSDPNGLGTGDYFFTQEGVLNAGDSHVLTTEPNTMIIGYTTLTYTQFSNSLVYTGGTNIDVSGTVISLTGTVAATNGGTGTSTVTTGDLLYGSGTNTWSKLPLGIGYKSLIVNAAGTQVEWNAVALNQTTAVSGQLNVSNGGTGASVLTGYVIGNGTSAMTASATIPNTDITGLGTMSTQNANSVAITGGAIDNTTIGASTAAAGTFTTMTATTGIFGGTF